MSQRIPRIVRVALLLLCCGCRAMIAEQPPCKALHPLLTRLLSVDPESKVGQTQFFRILDELASLQGPSGALRPDWTRAAGQKLSRGEASLVVGDGRKYLVVALQPLGVYLSGDYPLLILLFTLNGEIVDQALCTGDAFHVRLFLAFQDPPSPMVIIAVAEGEDWAGTISVEHRNTFSATAFPKNTRVEANSRTAGIFALGIVQGQFRFSDAPTTE